MGDQTEPGLGESPIKRFAIQGLFGDRDVDIVFESPVTILIADNGSGKTTILSIIYAVLSRNFYKLRKYQFDSIAVELQDGRSIVVTAEMAHSVMITPRMEPRLRRITNRFSEEYMYRIFDETRGLSLSEFRRHPGVVDFAETAGVPLRYVLEMLRSEFSGLEDKDQQGMLSTRKELAEAFPYENLYFPTYRRIEEEMEDLGYARREGAQGEGLIRFGMGDVIQRIKDITGRIEKSSVEWYSRISGQMLSQLVDGITVNEQTKSSIQDRSALKIVLDRVGNNIGAEQKLRIMQLVESEEILHQKYDTLAYFLANLIQVYDQQREYDGAIKEFTRVCNKYLIDKEVVYDESSVDLKVIYKSNGKPVELAKLSSGEKQIVSLFSRLYLESGGGGENLSVLFDEPELSLSIEWQKMLLPDIMQSSRCRFLLATTHSPFIFENSLDAKAYDLARFVRRDPLEPLR